MEVEVKLRLPSSAAHERLSTILSSHHRCTHFQENIFFDGPKSELSSNLAALRLRFYDLESRCVSLLNRNPKFPPESAASKSRRSPSTPPLAANAPPSRGASSKLDPLILSEENVRTVYEWNGLKLELDETHYSFGTCYEIECESSEPETARNLLEGLYEEQWD
ncbi:hypothetical protein DH2020_038283 [Rehmannia glutinosa]|uniref:CYTH domain-containing protein n=1 Tax=Rehmannia glutinosa TaxID=99300 RepID=A0ABR0V097_REHGL